jgi:hypothetical protein
MYSRTFRRIGRRPRARRIFLLLWRELCRRIDSALVVDHVLGATPERADAAHHFHLKALDGGSGNPVEQSARRSCLGCALIGWQALAEASGNG